MSNKIELKEKIGVKLVGEMQLESRCSLVKSKVDECSDFG